MLLIKRARAWAGALSCLTEGRAVGQGQLVTWMRNQLRSLETFQVAGRAWLAVDGFVPHADHCRVHWSLDTLAVRKQNEYCTTRVR